MALACYRKQDINEMDVNHIPEGFINYIESLDDERKSALLCDRRDIGVALGFYPKESLDVEDDSLIPGEETETTVSTQAKVYYEEYLRILHNPYEGLNILTVVRDNMPQFEALTIPDGTDQCVVHRINLIRKNIKYRFPSGAIRGVPLFICTKCNRVFVKTHSKALIQSVFSDAKIQYKIYSLSLSNQYLHDLIPVRELEDKQIKVGVVKERLRALLNASISEADAFYNIVGQGYISLEEYHQIKRPILLDLLYKACSKSLECANALFKDRGKGIVSQIEYDSIRKPFILRQLCDLYGVNPKKADAFYRREAFSVVSKAEYDKIHAKFHVLDRLKEICETNIRAADQFYADQTNKDVALNEYLEIKRSALLKQLKTICQQSIPDSDALFADCAKDIVTLQEYNEIRRPVVTRILQDKCECSLRDAQLYYQSYAKEILTERDYNNIRKPFLLAELRRLFAEDYMGALEFYKRLLSQIISEEEFRKEAAEFVSSWFVAQKAEGHFEGNLPDQDQAKAISAIRGNVLITARAGSGKTATMINRAYFMIKHCRIPAEKILMLAFNKDAAQQMRDRLNGLLKGNSSIELHSMPYVMTFHALAYRLVLPEEAILYDDKDGPQTQSRLLQDKIIGEYLAECLQIRGFASQVRKLMMNYFKVKIDDREFLRRDEYLELKCSAPQESLKGDAIKSYGEKRIANFLFEHDVEYLYERSFRWNGRTYRPDFTIPVKKLLKKKGGLIVEYLGLQGDSEYDKQTDEKRKYWEAHPEWQLVEIGPSDINQTDAEFEAWFTELLRKHRVYCRKLSEDEIWERARKHAINAFTKAMLGFIQRCRKLCISPDDLHARIQKFSDGTEEELLFANLAEKFYRSYLNRVKATGQDDFDGLMIRAIDSVNKGITVFKGKNGEGDLSRIQYIAIDEYQDFSELFYQLVTAIQKINPTVNLYCVGDDWQAINGFAGSDLRFFRDFDRYFGQTIHIELLNNYRSQKAIVDAGNALMRGLGTPGKAVVPANHVIGKVYLCYVEEFSPTEREITKYGFDLISPMVRRIIYKQQKRRHSVALLDRRSMVSKDIASGEGDVNERTRELSALEKNMQSLFPGAELDSSTVHSFKGLERDAVILLDVTDSCFPLIHPHWRFSRIIGESIPEIIEAERRLFYVALTRPKCDLYLLTEIGNESTFLHPLREFAEVTQIDWREYPSDLDTDSFSIEVENQPGKGISPTQDIRDLLKQAGFRWSANQKVWGKNVDKVDYSATQLQQEEWYMRASGIIVSIYDPDRKVIDEFIK